MSVVPLLPNVRSRIILIWSLVTLGLIVYLVCWVALSMFFIPLLDVFAASVSAPYDSIVTLLRNIFLWSPAIAIFGWVLFGISSSSRKDVSTWSE